MCAVRLLHADMHNDLGQSNPLVATLRRVYVFPGIRQAQFPNVSLHPPHGARSLFVVPRQLCQGYTSLNDLVWLVTHERFSLSHRSASTQQGISHSYSICVPCCSRSRPLRPKFSAYPLVIHRGVQSVKHHFLYPSRCLEPSSLSDRPFGVSFHSHRPSIDLSVGSPPSLRGHSTGALSLCIPAKSRLHSLRTGKDINRKRN